ncbi:MAG: tRNA (adenosine(37)-N6)-dimethylallyltransferase MiaA [Candidatus Pacebacteria bacterium]|nr:tRNA (adenosine(37)-N6)-dimethylallyltransferase MiaA [Candidatus Paceibacterota bacterium]
MQRQSQKKEQIIVICGPTATGKSDHAVQLAKEINGEVISADSRQVYRGMDIGSGKITTDEMQGVPHYGLDIVDPTDDFSVAQYAEYAHNIIDDIIGRGKTPILCGGTGFFIDAVIHDRQFPAVPPNENLRKELSTKTTEELFLQLQSLDSEYANIIDQHNPHRLIRAIEIATELGSVPPLETPKSRYNAEIIHIDKPDPELRERIKKRLITRLEQGMAAEAQHLYDSGVSWERLEGFGLEYRYIAEFLQGKITHEQMIEEITNKSWQYAKRQRTWFKKYVH